MQANVGHLPTVAMVRSSDIIPRMHPAPCPSREELESFVQGTSDASQEVMSAHLAECVTCSMAAHRVRARTHTEAAEITGFVGPPRPLENKPERFSRGTNLGRYVVLETLGAGGMGVVYSAYDPKLDRKVALKLLHVSPSESDSAGPARLLREAQAMARLSHPNVLTVHDVGTLPSGDVFLAMDLVEGQTFRGWLRERPRTPREVLSIMLQAGEGLYAAHETGLVHRDFKPDNMLVRADGRVFVTDFGLARRSGSTPDAPPVTSPLPDDVGVSASVLNTPLTQAGQIAGTPAYMAPEQFRGKPGDVRSDQFSFGVTLYLALYGQHPYPTPSLTSQWIMKEPPRDREVPAWIRKVTLRCLSVDPADRFPTLAAALEALRKDPSVTRRRYAWATAALVAVTAITSGAVSWARESPQVCRGAESLLSGVWDREVQQTLRQAFIATGAPQAEAAFGKIQVVLGDYASAWGKARQAACEATRIHHEQSEDVLQLRMTCLDGRRQELAALVNELRVVDKAVLSKAMSAAHALGDLRHCADVPALKAPLPPPTDPAVQARVGEVRKKLARVEAQFRTGRLPEANSAVDALRAEAAAIAYAPLTAEAIFLQAIVRSSLAGEEGLSLLREAMWTAIAGRHDLLAAQAMAEELRLEINLRHWDRAEVLEPRLDALIERAGRPDALEARRLSTLVAGKNRTPEQAADASFRAIGLWQRVHGTEQHPDVAVAWNSYGYRLSDAGKLEAALAAYQKALELRTEILGRDHQDVGFTQHNISHALHELGRFEEAARYANRAVEIFLLQQGPNGLPYQLGLINEGEALRDLGRFAQARQRFSVAREKMSARMTYEESLFRMAEEDLAMVELETGGAAQALERYDLLLASLAGAAADDAEVTRLKVGRARALVALGRTVQARALLEGLTSSPHLMSSPPRVRGDFERAQAELAHAQKPVRLDDVRRHAGRAAAFFEQAHLRAHKALVLALVEPARTTPVSAPGGDR